MQGPIKVNETPRIYNHMDFALNAYWNSLLATPTNSTVGDKKRDN